MSRLEEFQRILECYQQEGLSDSTTQLDAPATDEKHVPFSKAETEYEKAIRIFQERRLLVIESQVLGEQIVIINEESTLDQYPQHKDKVHYTLAELKGLVLRPDKLSQDELRIIHLMKKETLLAKKPCRVCGDLEKWKTTDGRWLCGKCHPPASPALAVKWLKRGKNQ